MSALDVTEVGNIYLVLTWCYSVIITSKNDYNDERSQNEVLWVLFYENIFVSVWHHEHSKTPSFADNNAVQGDNNSASDASWPDSGKKNTVDDITHKLQNTMLKEHQIDGKDNNATCKDEKNEKEVERQRQLAAAAKQAEERLNEIRAENRRLKEAKQCRVCRDRDANRMFLPCAHLCSCNLCSPALRNCPQCKGSIKGIISVYFS